MDVLSIVIAAVGSGLVATVITIIVQKCSEAKKVKIQIFETLMSHRYLITDKENVEALNRVEVIFYNKNNVRKAWKEFLDIAGRGGIDRGVPDREGSYDPSGHIQGRPPGVEPGTDRKSVV